MDTHIALIKRALKGDFPRLTQANVIMGVSRAMVAAEQIRGMTGAEKKEAVMAAVRQLMAETGDGGDLDQLLDVIVPATIDQLIVASRGGLELNVSGGCLPCFR